MGTLYLGQGYFGQGSAEEATVVIMMCASITIEPRITGTPEIEEC